MMIIDELYNTAVLHISSNELVGILEEIKKKKENTIQLLKFKINKFEVKKRKEEAYYQSLSIFKKMFISRPPSHHQAVEYLVNVKDRFIQIEGIRQSLVSLDQVIVNAQTIDAQEELRLPHVIVEEIRNWKGTEDYLK